MGAQNCCTTDDDEEEVDPKMLPVSEQAGVSYQSLVGNTYEVDYIYIYMAVSRLFREAQLI